MATFLITPRMSPALAARIEASVRGKRRSASPRGFGPRIPLAALLPCVAIIVVLGLAMMNHWFVRREVEHARGDVLRRVAAQRASMPAEAAAFLPTTRASIARMAGPYEGDLVGEELRTPGALQARLSRPAVFLRGSQAKLSRPDQLSEAASASVKDAVLLCLSDPPDSRSEKALLQKVRKVNFAAVLPSVRRFYDAEAGLGLLQPGWEERVRAAGDLKAIHALDNELSRAPVEDGKLVAAAELLVVVIDEAPEEPSNDERRLEERAHAIRLGLVDLRGQSVLLRLRRSIDPGSYSASMRAAHAHAITGCLMAIEARAATGS